MLSEQKNVPIAEEKVVYVWRDDKEVLIAGKVGEQRFALYYSKDGTEPEEVQYLNCFKSVINSMAYFEQFHKVAEDEIAQRGAVDALKGFNYPDINAYPVQEGLPFENNGPQG